MLNIWDEVNNRSAALILSAHYRYIANVYQDIYENIHVLRSPCHRKNSPILFDVNLKEHKLRHIKSNWICDSGLLMWQFYSF